MKLAKPLQLLITAALLATTASAATRVEGVGRAPGDSPTARTQALTDALRDAVRKGVGVDLNATTKVTNFTLDYDRVFAAAFGHVKDYKIIDQYIDEAEIYHVKIEATVEAGQPEMRDLLALKHIIRLKESPRVLVRTRETYTGMSEATVMLEGMLQEIAVKTQMQVVNLDQVRETQDRRARRDELVGNAVAAHVRQADIQQQYDVVIDANLRGSVGPLEDLYGVKTRAVSFGIEMKATWADTGDVVAAVSLPSVQMNSSITAPEQAMRASVERYLKGEAKGVPLGKDGFTIFRHIIAYWITELDLGARMHLEFKQIDQQTFDTVLKVLQQTEGIGYAWSREFDSRLLSKIGVESRLGADRLKDVVLVQLGNHYKLDRFTRHYLQFVPDPKVTAVPAGIPQTTTADAAGTGTTQPVPDPPAPVTGISPAVQSSPGGMPPWVWALAGAAVMGLLFVAYSLGKSKGGGNG